MELVQSLQMFEQTTRDRQRYWLWGGSGDGVTDDTAAIQPQTTQVRLMLLPERYLLGRECWTRTDSYFFGEGDASILKLWTYLLWCSFCSAFVPMLRTTYRRDCLARSSAPRNSGCRWVLSLNTYWVLTALVVFSLDNVTFIGFQGDGIYFISGFVVVRNDTTEKRILLETADSMGSTTKPNGILSLMWTGCWLITAYSVTSRKQRGCWRK